MEVLIVNPLPLWAQRIKARLRSTGAKVSVVDNWNHATEILEEAWPDILIIEDRILEKDAAGLLVTLRQGEWLPVIVPTDLGHLSGDSETISPRAEEILRRLEMIVTRLLGVFESAGKQSIRVGRLTIDPSRKEVVFAARRVRLPPNQFRLLLYLALNAGRVIEQRELVREVWGLTGSETEARELIKTYVRLIRRKLGWTDEANNYLQSVRGFGYMLRPPPRGRDKRPNHVGSDQPPEKGEPAGPATP